MRRFRASLAFLAILVPWASAEAVTVTTTADELQANDQCSLREAVEYVNRGKPAGGYLGCVQEEGDSDFIDLPASATPYRIEGSAITLRTGVVINGEGRKEEGGITEIRAMGRHRAFIVHHDPQFLAPGCALAIPRTCASSPRTSPVLPTFDLDGGSDTAAFTGSNADYLTDQAFPEVVGRLPGVATLPLPAYDYLVRVYRMPASGDPVEVGRVTVPFSASPIDWAVRVTLADTGIIDLRYTVQVVNSSGTPIAEASALEDSPSLRLALVEESPLIAPRLSKLILTGGCAAADAVDCATVADDTTTVVNSPLDADYDPLALSYRHALTGTAGNGGVIFSSDKVVLSDVLIRHGQAERGGALYVAGDGGVEADDTEFRENRAVRGAAVYAAANAVKLVGSLLTRNDVLAAGGGVPVVDATAGGAIIEVGGATVPSDLTVTTLQNVTISGNRGLALSLRTGGQVNGATIIRNDGGGVHFNGEVSSVYNSILADNGPGAGALDCQGLGGGPALTYNLVLSSGSCPPAGNVTTDNQPGSDRQLLAAGDENSCTGQWGLLCPLADHGGATFVHLPRLLDSYLDSPIGLGASLIVNRGSPVDGVAQSCLSEDQRGEARPSESCSIGAVELQTVEGTLTTTGGVIKQGGTWTQLATEDMGDEELLPPARCEQLFPPDFDALGRRYPPPSLAPDRTRVVADSYTVRDPANAGDALVTAAGCPWLERAPGRGVVTFSPDGKYSYRPSSDFHGLDRFQMRAVTMASAFNVLTADRSRGLNGRVIVEPAAGLTSDKLGGAVDAWGLLLVALAVMVRRRGGKA